MQLLGLEMSSSPEVVSVLPRFLRQHSLTSATVFDRLLAYRDALPDEVDAAFVVISTPAVLLVETEEIPRAVGEAMATIDAELAVRTD